MPVSGKEELGMQSSSSFVGIPLKKRRFPFILPSSPPRDKPASICGETELKNEESGSTLRSAFNHVETTCCDGKSDVKQGSSLEVKQEKLEDDANKNLVLSKMDCSGSKPSEADNKSAKSAEEPPGLKPVETDKIVAQFTKELSGSKAAEAGNVSSRSTEEPFGSKPNEMSVVFDQSTKESSESKPATETSVLSVQSKKESTEKNITHAQPNVKSLESKFQVANTNICSGSADSAENVVKRADTLALAENGRGVVGNISVNVKREITSEQVEKAISIKLQPSAELSLGPKRPLGVKNIRDSEKFDPSLLSLSLNKDKVSISQIGSLNSHSNDKSPDTDTNRSNWDLNTTIDAWKGSGDGCQDTDNRHDLKSSLSSYRIAEACTDKGKQICEQNEQKSKFPAAYMQSRLSCKPEDSLCLSLGSPFSRGQFGSMGRPDSIPQSIVPRNLMKMNSIRCGNVKAEPIDETSKQGFTGSSDITPKTLDDNSLKKDLVQRGSMEPGEFPMKSAQKLIEKKTIKSEPIQETNQETCRVSSNLSVGNIVPSKENSSSTLPVPLTPEKPLTSRLPTFSELSVSGELSNQSEHSVHTKDVYVRRNALNQMNADMATENSHYAQGLNTSSSKIGVCESEGVKIDAMKTSELKQDNEHPHSLAASGEGSVSGEQDMNISPCGSDYESDGHHAFTVQTDAEGRPCGKQEDDYEDGEVRESILEPVEENPTAEGTTDPKNNIDSDTQAMDAPCVDDTVQSACDVKDETAMIDLKTTNDCTEECGGSSVSDKIVDQFSGKDDSSSNPTSQNVLAAYPYDSIHVNDAQEIHFNQEATGKQEENIDGVSCDGALNANNEMDNSAYSADGADNAEKLNSSLTNVETPQNANSAKESSATKSRIINLPRSSSSTSPSKARAVIGRQLSPRSGRERYFGDQDEKLQHPSGNRGEMYGDGSNRYTRDRFRDRPYESSRVSFMRGRGRGSARFGRSHRDWDSERDFRFNRRDNYSFPRHKHGAAIDGAEDDRNDFDIAPIRGRKLLNSESPSFRHSSSRRLSPPVDRGIQMLGRIPRNSSPSRCTDEDGSELVGHRHGERFVRDMQTEIIDPVYRSEGQYMRGKKFFPAFQRRGFSQMRSKSPDGSQRHHSPSPWSSSHRRPIEGLDDLSELPQRRSPAMYRVERMRSPECDYFSEEMVPRRRGSPSYVARSSNNMRDVDVVQEHVHPSSLSNRSPNRLFARNPRRVDGINRRERVDDDEYFGGPINSGRVHELRGEGSGDERRKYSERRGIVRSFRPYSNNDSENFRFHPDDGSRNFRCSPEEEAEFVERTNTRDREFDGRVKNGPGIGPRRMRNIEEQEENYRPSSQIWHGEEFNDGSRMKRRRF